MEKNYSHDPTQKSLTGRMPTEAVILVSSDLAEAAEGTSQMILRIDQIVCEPRLQVKPELWEITSACFQEHLPAPGSFQAKALVSGPLIEDQSKQSFGDHSLILNGVLRLLHVFETDLRSAIDPACE